MTSKKVSPWAAMATELVSEPQWGLFADYCEARESNLRDRAVVIAEQFIEAARIWPFEERKRFGLWLANCTGSAMERSGLSKYSWRFSTGGPGLFAPRRVVDEVLRPMLIEWCGVEPANPEPYFWLGLYGDDPAPSLQHALNLDPTHGPTRAVLAGLILNAVEYAQHELPSGYLGEPSDDLLNLNEAKELVAEAVAPSLRASISEKIFSLENNAKDWISLRDELKGLGWDTRLAIWNARPKPALVPDS